MLLRSPPFRNDIPRNSIAGVVPYRPQKGNVRGKRTVVAQILPPFRCTKCRIRTTFPPIGTHVHLWDRRFEEPLRKRNKRVGNRLPCTGSRFEFVRKKGVSTHPTYGGRLHSKHRRLLYKTAAFRLEPVGRRVRMPIPAKMAQISKAHCREPRALW